MTVAAAEATRSGAAVRYAAATFAAVAVVLFVAVALFDDGSGDAGLTFAGDALLEGWVQFDGGWYRSIADEGYMYTPGVQSSVAFFPAYPLLMRAGGEVIGNSVLTGILVTALSGAASALLFARWCSTRLSPLATRTAVGLLLLYPFAWYLYGAVYADALLVACVLAAFLLIESGHPILAGLVGIVATAARPTGVALVVGLIAVVLDQRGVVRWNGGMRWRVQRSNLRRLRASDAGVLLAAAGLVAYCVYLWVRWDDPVAFATVQEAPGWNQGAGPYTWFKIQFLKYVVAWEHPGIALKLLVHALLTLGALLLIPRVARRFGWPYAAYVVVALAIPLIGSSTFMGLARYLLAVFPCFAVLGELLAERVAIRRALVGASGIALVSLTVAYSRGYYLA